MTTASESPPDNQPPQVGTSSWRSEVLQQAERLDDELTAIPADTLATAPPELVEQAQRHIAEARQLAEHKTEDPFEFVRNWWTGNAVNAAWNHLQSAREDLLVVGPSEAVRALLPGLARRAVSVSPDPAHDPNVEAVKEAATNAGAITGEQRLRIRAAQAQIRVAQDEAHKEARSFRNNLWLLTAALTVGSLVLAAIEIDEVGFEYLVVGAVAGLLTTALAWRNLTRLTGPFAIDTAQAR